MATNCPQQYKCFCIKWYTFISLSFTDIIQFLGAFTKLRKATISFVIFVHREQLGFHWTDSHEILYLSTFQQCEEKVQVLLKSDENNG
jgi:hypothetical protein